MLIEQNASLRAFNSFGVEARAQRLIRLNDIGSLPEALEAFSSGLGERLVLGGGSNVLFACDVFDGTVLKVGLRGRRVLRPAEGVRAASDQEVIVEAEAGEPWHPFVQWTLAQGLYGLENLSLIPGTVGAAPMQNIGAYGVELRDCFDSLEAIDLQSGQARRFELDDCRFAYRDSIFRQPQVRWLIRSVRLRLSRVPRLRINYPDLRARLDPAVARPEDVAREVIAIRQQKLPDPAQLGNAGSFFRNPQLPHEIIQALTRHHPALPVYPADRPDRLKIAAAWLIEQCGWKGLRRGDAGVHAQHALVLVNHGSARGSDLLALARDIQQSVLGRFGISLEAEPRIVGH
ncbi:MAG: UDP-N-acetylmuramate dehydrogenase [Pseudomonadota bacterium]|jgi:UDP-N-acetylmuramate dehydrogenase